jgi:branched-chain amino acid transport system permease protein
MLSPFGASSERSRTTLAVLTLVVAGTAAFALSGTLGDYGLNAGATVFAYIALAEGWNILAGMSGQISLGVGAFVGVGAYSMGLLMVHADVGWFLGILVAAGAATVLGMVLAVPLLRLRGDYFAIGTLAAALALQAWLLNWQFAGGSSGISIPINSVPSFTTLYQVGVIVAVIGVGTAIIVRESKFGLRLLAVREHEDAAASLGVNTWRQRFAALALSSSLMGLAGGTFALLQVSFEPNGMLGLNWTIAALLMVIIGGSGTIVGPIAGAIFVYYVIDTQLASYPAISLFVEGGLLVAIVRFAPRGIVPLGFDGARAAISTIRCRFRSRAVARHSSPSLLHDGPSIKGPPL